MFIVENYTFAVVLCFISMICWGSWANTQKLAAKNWRYELFYWDYVLGIFLFSIILGLSLGSIGEYGRPFIADLMQADFTNLSSAIIAGVIFNASNILIAAAIALTGMSVAFPLGVGLALVLGVFTNYLYYQKGDPVLLGVGVLLVTLAIILNGIALSKTKREKSLNKKGIYLSIIAGILMSFSYQFVIVAMDVEDFVTPALGKLTPYSAFFGVAVGTVASNFIFNTILMKKPLVGEPVTYASYFKGNIKTHLVGILGGLIWGLGTASNYIAASEAGSAISYGLGQGATMIAALWGVFVWQEFKGAGKQVYILLGAMFLSFIAGLISIVVAGF